MSKEVALVEGVGSPVAGTEKQVVRLSDCCLPSRASCTLSLSPTVRSFVRSFIPCTAKQGGTEPHLLYSKS